MNAAATVPESMDDPRVKPVAREVASLTEQANALEITTADRYERGAQLLTLVKSTANEVEQTRKGITRPLDEAKKQVMNLFRPLMDSLSGAEKDLKRRLAGYSDEQERIARDEQRKADERARREQEKFERQAEEAEAKGRTERAETLRDRASTTIAAPAAPATPKVKGLSKRENWKFRIDDPSKLPREYLMPDEKKIGRVVRALKQDTEIDGVRVWNESSVAARSA